MNLYDRLKPKHREKLNQNLHSFPMTANEIMDELMTKQYVIHLTYGTLVDIYRALDMNVLAMMPYELFEEAN